MADKDGVDTKAPQEDTRVSRRDFLRVAGVGSLLTSTTAAAVTFTESAAYAQSRWDHEADIVVVGSGAAGCTAALIAHNAGASVVMLEKAATVGGTTAKSGGMYWIPNNFRMQERGVQDSKPDLMRYMVRMSYPTLYNPGAPRFGIPEHEYSLIEAFYDNAAPIIAELRTMEVGDMQPGPTDYYASPAGDRYPQIPERSPIRGRALFSSDRTGNRHPGDLPRTYQEQNGGFLIAQFKAAIDKRGIPLLMPGLVPTRRMPISARTGPLLASARRRPNGSRRSSASQAATGRTGHLQYLPCPPTYTPTFVKPTRRNNALSSVTVYSRRWNPRATLSKLREMSCGPFSLFGVTQM